MAMTLVQLRQKFIELSGRYDLTSSTSTWADNGANFYIQAGQDFLDRRANNWKKQSSLFIKIAAGVWYHSFQNARIIESVYINNTTGRSRLIKKDLDWILENYTTTVAAQETGTPLYFCPVPLRTTEVLSTNDKDDLGAFFNYVIDTSDTYRGIVIMPPADEITVIRIIGQFYSTALSADANTSFWSSMHSDILILAALYQLEVLGHRNAQGAKDYLAQIDTALADIDKDMAEEESFDGTDWEPGT